MRVANNGLILGLHYPSLLTYFTLLTYYFSIDEGHQYALVAFSKGPALSPTSAECQLLDQYIRGQHTLDEISDYLEFPALPPTTTGAAKSLNYRKT